MTVDPEQLYYDIEAFIKGKGLEVPPEADDLLGDAAGTIAEFNNREF